MKSYYQIFSSIPDGDYATCVSFLKNELCDLFDIDYSEQFDEATLVLFEDTKERHYTFLFDCTQDDNNGIDGRDARVVAVVGQSHVANTPAYRNRQAMFLGSFSNHERLKDYDKGHFIPHAIDGQPDHNLYPQLRELNRGLSQQGKLYRSMERYCKSNEGVFFFVRPIYNDPTWIPFQIDFGIFTKEKGLILNRFDNKK